MGDSNYRRIPTEVVSLSDKTITQLAAGNQHSLAIDNEGNVYAFGKNDRGQLVIEDKADFFFRKSQLTPVEVKALSEKNITKIFTTLYYHLAFSNEGKVYSWGRPYEGSKRFPSETHPNPWVIEEVEGLSDKTITQLAPGSMHNIALDSEGQVYAWGYNFHGQLGLSDRKDRYSPTEIPSFSLSKNYPATCQFEKRCLFNREECKIYDLNDDTYGELELRATHEKLSPEDVYALSFESEIFSQIKTELTYNLVLSSDAKVYSWGKNNYGQLGLSDTNDRNSPTEIKFLRDKNINHIASSECHVLALSSNGQVYAWGFNQHGNLGLNDAKNRSSPTEIEALTTKSIIRVFSGGHSSFALSSDGKVYAWGRNTSGELGLGDRLDRLHPAELKDLTDKRIIYVTSTYNYTVALSMDGRLYVWGANNMGQLGLDI